MAIFAVGGLIWMGWKIIKGEWREYALIWFWTVFYTTFQAVRWNPTMRYFLLVYPVLAITAAWCLWQVFRQLDQKGLVQNTPEIGRRGQMDRRGVPDYLGRYAGRWRSSRFTSNL